MSLATRKTTDRIPSVLPREQALALFEAEARRITGLNAERFLAKWDGGMYEDLDDTPHGREIAYLALLIPFGRQLS
ncbi:MAG: hypothetical protein M3464_07365 [Chloroflexota bacterium]|nr:hypothetical protein [Chloroflexota bacterium]